ncbi:MAG: GAF domain-containing protein [Ignavibacteriales bacterium]|nr:MAG: GAF domain-containing protein [Ignavibacteriales bacterium]
MIAQTINAIKDNRLFTDVLKKEIDISLSPENVLFKLKGDVIFKEGDPGENIFLIVSGEVRLVKEKLLGLSQKVVRKNNDFFGEEDFLEGMPRTSTAFALKDCKFVVFDKAEMDYFTSDNGDVLERLRNFYSETAEEEFTGEQLQEETPVETTEKSIEDSVLTEEIKSDKIEEYEPLVKEQEPQEVDDKNSKSELLESTPKKRFGQNKFCFDQLHLINKAVQIVNSNVKLDEVLKGILLAAQNLTHAERGTIYLVNKEKDEIWSKVKEGDEVSEIRLKIGEGLAGWVAKNKEIVNITDAPNDERFNSDYDKLTGYHTRTVLCFPIKDKAEEVIGVLQLLNCKYGEFTKLDEEFLEMLSAHAALALENADLVEKLLQAERITSLGKMANFLIQDIKKPILVSKRYTEHLKSKNLSPEVNQVIEMMLEQLNHIVDLIQSTSSYSEGSATLHSVSSKLNEALEEILTKLESNVRIRNCELVKQYDRDIMVKLDKKEFTIACMNILRNACDAMPDGGKILVSTKVEGRDVEISFKDNGIGIPDSIKDRIFEPFMSHGKKDGTGLGLSITKSIIENHDGRITVESDLGEGSTFIITLPAV